MYFVSYVKNGNNYTLHITRPVTSCLVMTLSCHVELLEPNIFPEPHIIKNS